MKMKFLKQNFKKVKKLFFKKFEKLKKNFFQYNQYFMKKKHKTWNIS